MQKIMAMLFLFMVTIATTAGAANYIEPGQLKEALEKKKTMIIVDIQPAKEFEKQHLTGSIETNAFPVKTADEKKLLDKLVPIIKASKGPVIIVCPRGKGGAKNSYDYLLSQDIAEERLHILKNGIAGWPYKEYLSHGR